ncbi:MAG: hypothetical protein KF685_02960 [Acidobacteria bacterium]|nr:hypothetical protein [Acidobacteriota bacterium]
MAVSLLFCGDVYAQDPTPTPTPEEIKEPTPIPTPGDKAAPGTITAEQVAESVIFIYGLGRGREGLTQIRKTAFERGKTTVTNAEGKKESANYQRWVIRGDVIDKDRVRLEQDFPAAKYSLVFSEDKVFGIYQDRIFAPSEDAIKLFENQTFRNIEALLRYKENESKIELGERKKIMGVDLMVLDLTDKKGGKVRYYISARSFRIIFLEYEDQGTTFTRRFYDYRNVQGTLVPYRTVLLKKDETIEESTIGTITYGQRVDEGLFIAN